MTSSCRSGTGCVLSRFWPSWAPAWSSPWTGFQNILHVVFLASFALSSQSQTSTFFVVSNSIRYSFYRRGLARYLHRHLNILLFQKCGIASFFFSRLAPRPLQPQVPHLVCVCELANVRDLQDHALFARQFSFDTLSV